MDSPWSAARALLLAVIYVPGTVTRLFWRIRAGQLKVIGIFRICSPEWTMGCPL